MFAKYLKAMVFFEKDTAASIKQWVDWIDPLLDTLINGVTLEERWNYAAPSLELEELFFIDSSKNRGEQLEYLKHILPADTSVITIHLYQTGKMNALLGDVNLHIERTRCDGQNNMNISDKLCISFTIHERFWEHCAQKAWLHHFKHLSAMLHACYAFIDLAPIAVPCYEQCPYFAFGGVEKSRYSNFIPAAYWGSMVQESHFSLRDQYIPLEAYLEQSPCEVVESWTNGQYKAHWLQMTRDASFNTTYYPERMRFRHYFHDCIPKLIPQYIENVTNNAFLNPYMIHLLPVAESEYESFDTAIKSNRWIRRDRKRYTALAKNATP